MRRWAVVVVMFVTMAAFPWGSQGAPKNTTAVAQPLTFEKLFGSTSPESVIQPSLSTATTIPDLPPLFNPIVVRMVLPLLKQSWEYPATPMPVANNEPSRALPIGVGPVAHGGKFLDLRVSLGQFENPVDVYFVLSAPAMDPDHVYILRSDDSLEAYSLEEVRERKTKKLEKILSDLKGIQPWKRNTIGNLNETLVNNLPVSKLPSGIYDLYLVAAPAGTTEAYYQWKTPFLVRNLLIPELNIFPDWPSNGDWFLKQGDLSVKRAEPVQVVDGWPAVPLVKGKGTVFRVTIQSTFLENVDASVRLTLPPESWSYVDRTVNGPILFPPGWGPPTLFGPFPLQHGENEIILPKLPGGLIYAKLSETRPTGVVDGQCNPNGLCSPDLRVLPCPKEVNQPTAFTVEVDPDNSVQEADETNNIWTAGNSGDPIFLPVETRPFKILFVPFMDTRGCSPEIGEPLESFARYATGYFLGTFPIADGAIGYEILPPIDTFACNSNPQIQECGCKDPNASCGYRIWDYPTNPGAIYGELQQLAIDRGADIAFGVYCGGGGQSASPSAAIVGGNRGNYMTAAHEATHSLTGAGDVYFLDCKACWLEAYTEIRWGDGVPVRLYCCDANPAMNQTTCANGRAENPLCYHLDPNDPSSVIWCDWNETTKNCTSWCDSRIDPWDCLHTCEAEYSGLYVTYNPDCRVKPPASPGFWAYHYFDINPAVGVTYFMDCMGEQSWWVPPAHWMKVGSSRSHCTGERYQDGYLNLLQKFRK